MTPEEKKLLQDTYELASANNVILRKMRNAARWAGVMRVLYWIIILAISFGAYIYAKPYVDKLRQVYAGFDFNINQINAMRDNLKNLGK